MPAVEQRHQLTSQAALALRLHAASPTAIEARGALLQKAAPALDARASFFVEHPSHTATAAGSVGVHASLFAGLNAALEGGLALLKGCAGLGFGVVTAASSGKAACLVGWDGLVCSARRLTPVSAQLALAELEGLWASQQQPATLGLSPNHISTAGTFAATLPVMPVEGGSRFPAAGTLKHASLDFLADWRELKLEREVWRSLDFLSQSRQALAFRRRYYADLFEPAQMTSKVSTWLPNHLIPG